MARNPRLAVTVLILSLVWQPTLKAAASDEAELSAQIESILKLPDTTPFVTLQEGAAYLDALCEDEDQVVGKVCDKYGDRIAAYGERLRRIQEQRAAKAREKGTSVTTRAHAPAEPAKIKPAASSQQMELINDICFSWRRQDEGQTQHLMQRWNARYPDYSPFSCPLAVDGQQVVD